MQIRKDEGRIEKWIMRRAFDTPENPFLPKHILYRQKEQFSDGVGYSWIDGLKAHAASQVTISLPLSLSLSVIHRHKFEFRAVCMCQDFTHMYTHISLKIMGIRSSWMCEDFSW
jgi:asparagine synthetase B (glutamine-hydrolysing)